MIDASGVMWEYDIVRKHWIAMPRRDACRQFHKTKTKHTYPQGFLPQSMLSTSLLQMLLKYFIDDEICNYRFGVDMSHALVLPAAASLTESCTAAAAPATRGRRGSSWFNWWQSWWNN